MKIPPAKPWSLLALSLVMIVSSVSGATTNVAFGGLSSTFRPAAITINIGDTVIWTGSGFHSVTGDSANEPLCGPTIPVTGCTNTFMNSGTFAYHCVQHGPFGMVGTVIVQGGDTPPSVAITSPVSGAVFAAPASVSLSVTVTNTGGTVTNVQFFSDANFLGAGAPFNLTTAPLAAGNYALTARATANTGLSATSAPVNISVVTPVNVTNFNPRMNNGQFVFDHTANPGLRYVVENTTNLADWMPVTTNTAASNSVQVGDTFNVGDLRFYRVGRLPNP